MLTSSAGNDPHAQVIPLCETRRAPAASTHMPIVPGGPDPAASRAAEIQAARNPAGPPRLGPRIR